MQFVLNYEEGGENAAARRCGQRAVSVGNVQPASYPDRHMSMEGIYEYGLAGGRGASCASLKSASHR